MLTILEAIKLSEKYLEQKGIESARINAELLLAEVLKCKRLDLYLSFDRPLTEDETSAYREFLRRRSLFEPLQYIVGNVEFYGYRFDVDKSVLIPRPETELLVELIISEHKNKSDLKILDVGTGSGNIAISLAKNISSSCITAIDKSEQALKTAQKNAELNGVADRINFLLVDIKQDLQKLTGRFDVVVSNPPYISSNEYPDLQPELVKFEPAEALTDYGDGLTFYRLIAELGESLLNKPGYLYFEIGQDQDLFVEEIMKLKNFKNIELRKDLQNINRVIRGIIN